MKLFISHSSTDRTLANSLAVRLRAAGHKVFIDQDALKPGQAFDQPIRQELANTDLLIFLASKESLSDESYALAELHIYMDLFPNPDNRVLPVLLSPSIKEKLPAYLSSVTFIEPKGNPEASITDAVDQIAKHHSKTNTFKLGLAVVIVSVLALMGWGVSSHLTSSLTTEILSVAKPTRGVGSQADTFELKGTVNNLSEETLYYTAIHVETEDPRYAATASDRVAIENVELTPKALESWSALVAFIHKSDERGVTAEESQSITWRVCLEFVDTETCSPWGNHTQNLEFGSPRPTLVDGVEGTVQGLITEQGKFLVITQNPNQIISLNSDGTIEKSHLLEAEPTAITAGPNGTVITTRAPDQLLQLDRGSLAPITSQPIPQLELKYENYTETVSSQPRGVADVGHGYWVTTSGIQGEAGTLFFSLQDKRWTTPSNLEDFAMGSEDWRLINQDNQAWAISSATTPSSLYRITTQGIQEFLGHDYDAISCATDIVAMKNQLFILSCEDEVIGLEIEQNKMQLVSNKGKLLTNHMIQADTWENHKIASSPPNLLVAKNILQMHNSQPVFSSLHFFDGEKQYRIVFEQNNSTIEQIAILDNRALIALRGEPGTQQTILFSLE